MNIRARQDKTKIIVKTSSRLVITLENGEKKPSNKFRRYSWQLDDDPLTVLIQYVGDESIKTVNYHRNSKKSNPQPMNPLLPSVRETIVNSPKTPARIYEEMRLNADNSPFAQSKLVPNNKSQVKNLQSRARRQRREAIGDEASFTLHLAPCTFHLAPCTPGRHLLVPPSPSSRNRKLPPALLQARHHGGEYSLFCYFCGMSHESCVMRVVLYVNSRKFGYQF